MTSPAISVILPQLYHPESGRLDAQRIGAFMDVPLARLADALGKRYTTLHKTPDAPAVQDGMLVIKRSLDILTGVFADPALVRAWLNTPHPDLGMRRPLEVILEGHAQIVAAMLEDAVQGQPS